MSISINKKHRDIFFLFAAAAAIISSGFELWPFNNSRAWQILNISNLCCIIGIAGLISTFIQKNKPHKASIYIPHISIIAYLVINFLSIGFADSFQRAASYTLKLWLVFLGGFWLFQRAMSNKKNIHTIYAFAAATLIISILGCLFVSLSSTQSRYGFFDSPFKYGTYSAVLVPLCCMYLFSGSKLQTILAVSILAAYALSMETAGCLIAITAGLITGFLMTNKKSVKIKILVGILLFTSSFVLAGKHNDIKNDFVLKEKDSVNLRQRYIEWQAAINILQKRGIIGTGAGCINDYRSYYYYRLPKLNTLKAFDQNGFLTVGAETGIFGSAAFCWIIMHFGSRLNHHKKYILSANRITAANAAAFTAALTANIFSSIHYNGILIVFVFLLSLISAVNTIFAGAEK